MSDERRQNRRVSQPLEGSWWGSSGSTRCRIGDLSQSGCFVQSLMNPASGEATTVTIVVGQESITLDATVVYAEHGMGFAVRFANVSPDQSAALARFVQAIESDGKAGAQ